MDWLKTAMGEKVENYLEWENGNARWKELINLWKLLEEIPKDLHI